MTFSEVRRGLEALSSLYVERRSRLGAGAALDGRGKRAAFALFYGPLHFLIVRRIVRTLELAGPRGPAAITDLGCGTGASGAAWALECEPVADITAFDVHPWALHEAARGWTDLGVRARAVRRSIADAPLPGKGGGVIAGWSINELDDLARGRALERLLDAGRRGARVLVCEPIARRPVPWWPEWVSRFTEAGGRADMWKFSESLPEPVRRLDRAAGLDHTRLAARSIALP